MKLIKFIAAILVLISYTSKGQSKIDSFKMLHDVKITIDAPQNFTSRNLVIVLYVLPNGNTTAQTMGKRILPGEDWHYDIQHIKAQTSFIRSKLNKNIVVVYAENDFKSWPLWKQKHPDYKKLIPNIVDTIFNLFPHKDKTVYLNGHSGGGSFIFGYIESLEKIPSFISRICFLDSNYGFDSSYYSKLKNWLHNSNTSLTVFAYNDSVALYNGKPIVSEKGGTWYKSHLMKQYLEKDFTLKVRRSDSLIFYESKAKKIAFFLKTNPDRKIDHTRQVELNGFIHSLLYGTKKENEGYEYFGKRAYSNFIK